MLLWYITRGYKALIHSDSAVKVLLANEIFKTGEFFPKDWNYVNGDIFILFGNALIAPALWMIKPGFMAHAISGIISSTVIISSIYILLRQQTKQTFARWLGVAVVTAGISGFIAENLYGQTAYGAILAISCGVLFFSIELLNRKIKTSMLIALFALLTLATWSNPLRAIVCYFIPIISISAYSIFDEKRVPTPSCVRRLAALIIILIGSFIIGTILHKYTLLNSNNTAGVASARWLNYDEIGRNFSFLFKGLFAIFGVHPTGESLFSITGVFTGIKVITFLGIISFTPPAMINLLNSNKAENRHFAVFCVTSLFINIFIQLFTSVPDMSDPIQSSRYLVPSIILMIIASIVWCFSENTFSAKKIALITCIFLLCVSGFQAYFRQGLSSESYNQTEQTIAHRQDLIDFLRKNNLRYGYAGYWGSGVISLLSDGDVRIRQVNILNGLPEPMRHLASNEWYRPTAWTGDTFLMLTPPEATLLDMNKLSQNGVHIIDKLDTSGYQIFVIKGNLSEKLPNWKN